jgi:general secretion pathway protein C
VHPNVGPRFHFKGKIAEDTPVNMQNVMSYWRVDSPERLFAVASERLPFWVSLVFVILIAYYLARITWLLLPASDQSLWAPPQVTGIGQAIANSGNADEQYGDIVNSHLFGIATESDAIPEPTETENAPDTRLNLKLRATVATTDTEIAHAIIADGSGNEKVYFVQDAVPGGATLHRVDPDRVILNRGGVLEALRLPKEFAGNPAATSRPANRRTSTAQTNVQQLLTQNAATLAEIIRPQPFMPNGQLKGYRVFPGRNRQQFISLGLRPGDLVTEINGVALNNPAQGMEIFSSLGDTSQVSVTIERNGRSQVLNLDTSNLTTARPSQNTTGTE